MQELSQGVPWPSQGLGLGLGPYSMLVALEVLAASYKLTPKFYYLGLNILNDLSDIMEGITQPYL